MHETFVASEIAHGGSVCLPPAAAHTPATDNPHRIDLKHHKVNRVYEYLPQAHSGGDSAHASVLNAFSNANRRPEDSQHT
jgi:hypothetical protein